MPFNTTLLRIFRVLAVGEAVSWAALLVGMYFKWIAGTTELGVQIAGPVHGALFVAYGLAALALWRMLRWPFRVAFFAGLSAVFPFATLLFERWAGQQGLLAAAQATDMAKEAGRKPVLENSSRE